MSHRAAEVPVLEQTENGAMGTSRLPRQGFDEFANKSSCGAAASALSFSRSARCREALPDGPFGSEFGLFENCAKFPWLVPGLLSGLQPAAPPEFRNSYQCHLRQYVAETI